jgi:hypothetical protein
MHTYAYDPMMVIGTGRHDDGVLCHCHRVVTKFTPWDFVARNITLGEIPNPLTLLVS